MQRHQRSRFLRLLRFGMVRLRRTLHQHRPPWFLLFLLVSSGAALVLVCKGHDQAESFVDYEFLQAAAEEEQKAERQRAQKPQVAVEHSKVEKLRLLLAGRGRILSSYPHNKVRVQFGDMPVTEAELDWVTDIPELSELKIENPAWTGEGLGRLQAMTNLRQLVLGSATTDAQLASIASLPGLRELVLDGTQVTDEGLAHLEGLCNLEYLGLAHTRITDAGLAHFKGLTGLKASWLERRKITDAGLVHLRGLTNLARLQVKDTAVTGKGPADLREHIPGVIVIGAGSGATP
ncbi:hypothetical protein AYO44_05550 [Planctomycetaceae bacterium SCGC AG-212-F19]|nr:hypothetical protein AYO44_05550 [Planctomycetaceae bacterium SCGC AG-212-F19]